MSSLEDEHINYNNGRPVEESRTRRPEVSRPNDVIQTLAK
jgi:hypothetical protein